MILANELWDLIDKVISGLLEAQAGEHTVESNRAEVFRFAEAYKLGMQDTATLFRVASGEPAYSPVVKLISITEFGSHA